MSIDWALLIIHNNVSTVIDFFIFDSSEAGRDYKAPCSYTELDEVSKMRPTATLQSHTCNAALSKPTNINETLYDAKI